MVFSVIDVSVSTTSSFTNKEQFVRPVALVLYENVTWLLSVQEDPLMGDIENTEGYVGGVSFESRSLTPATRLFELSLFQFPIAIVLLLPSFILSLIPYTVFWSMQCRCTANPNTYHSATDIHSRPG